MTGSITLIARTADIAAPRTPDVVPVRAAASQDAAELAELFYTSYAAQAQARYGRSEDISREKAQEVLRQLFDGEYGQLIPSASLVALDEDGSIMAASLVVDQRVGEDLPEAPYLFELFTRASNRRQGLGEFLVRTSSAALHQMGYDRLCLRIDEDNSPALALYLTLDFNRWHQAAEADDLENGD